MSTKSGHTMHRMQPHQNNLDFCLFGNLERVVNLNAEVSDCTLQLGAPKPELDCSQILGALVRNRASREITSASMTNRRAIKK